MPDTDGYTSSAVLLNYLNDLFPCYTQNNIVYRIHLGKEHGLLAETVPQDIGLVICVDSASNDQDEADALHERGIDFLIIDHHEASGYLNYATVINNQLCDYPNKTLSGVGVVWKFCCYLDSLIGTDYASKYYDLTATGIKVNCANISFHVYCMGQF